MSSVGDEGVDDLKVQRSHYLSIGGIRPSLFSHVLTLDKRNADRMRENLKALSGAPEPLFSAAYNIRSGWIGGWSGKSFWISCLRPTFTSSMLTSLANEGGAAGLGHCPSKACHSASRHQNFLLLLLKQRPKMDLYSQRQQG